MTAPTNDGGQQTGQQAPPANQPPAQQPPAQQPPANQPPAQQTAPKSDPVSEALAKATAELAEARSQLSTMKPVFDAAEKQRQDSLPEIDRLKEQNAQLVKSAAEAIGFKTAFEAAQAAQLPPEFIKFITATEPAAALEQAKELAAAVGGFQAPQQQQQRPDFRQGQLGDPPNGAAQMDSNQLLRAWMQRGR